MLAYLQPSKVGSIVYTHTHKHTHTCSLQPEWEECLLLNEQVEHFIQHEHLLFFELLDFSTPSSHLSPWYQIAWAFLQPRNHMGQRCRLQLYQYPRRYLCPANSIEVGVGIVTPCTASTIVFLLSGRCMNSGPTASSNPTPAPCM